MPSLAMRPHQRHIPTEVRARGGGRRLATGKWGYLVKLFIFPSSNTTNVSAGIGAGLWAVSDGDEQRRKELKTKSKGMPVGSAGVIWRTGERFFTTPFIVYSAPSADERVTDVWPETWILPFRIHTLGTPRKKLVENDAWRELPVPNQIPRTNITHVLRVNALTSFVPSDVSEQDWAILLMHLAE